MIIIDHILTSMMGRLWSWLITTNHHSNSEYPNRCEPGDEWQANWYGNTYENANWYQYADWILYGEDGYEEDLRQNYNLFRDGINIYTTGLVKIIKSNFTPARIRQLPMNHESGRRDGDAIFKIGPGTGTEILKRDAYRPTLPQTVYLPLTTYLEGVPHEILYPKKQI